jgi:hypothetical protein
MRKTQKSAIARIDRQREPGPLPRRGQQEEAHDKTMASVNTSESDGVAVDSFAMMVDGFGSGPFVAHKRRSSVIRKSIRSSLVGFDLFKPDEEVSIVNDVYNMLFFSKVGGQGFFFSMYIFLLKVLLYSLLMVDTIRNFYRLAPVGIDVRITQFFMLPVCIAMQSDLMATLYTITNVRYCPSIMEITPEATKWKFLVANSLRGLDGLYSLLVNFAVLLIADEVLPLFLHFAAFVFVQNIDDLALDMAEGGFLTSQLERIAYHVKRATLPRSHDKAYSGLGAALFLSLFSILLSIWTMIVMTEA